MNLPVNILANGSSLPRLRSSDDLMVERTYGERKEFRALVNSSGIPINQGFQENCIPEYRAAGFVPAAELK
jgi:hypothetical protein